MRKLLRRWSVPGIIVTWVMLVLFTLLPLPPHLPLNLRLPVPHSDIHIAFVDNTSNRAKLTGGDSVVMIASGERLPENRMMEMPAGVTAALQEWSPIYHWFGYELSYSLRADPDAYQPFGSILLWAVHFVLTGTWYLRILFAVVALLLLLGLAGLPVLAVQKIRRRKRVPSPYNNIPKHPA